jgi:ATP-dependent Clp protease ATP-binding subunit ClpC
MPEHPFHLVALVRELDNDSFLAEALFFPEVSCFGDDADALLRALLHNACVLLRHDEQAKLHQRRGPADVTADLLRLEVTPPPRSRAWRHPVELSLPVVRWRQGEDFLAAVPALGIEVIASKPEELDHLLPRHAHIALLREKHGTLERLTWLARGRKLEVRAVPFTLDRPSPKAAAIAEREARERKESVLPQVGTDLLQSSLAQAFEMEQPLALLAEALTGRAPRSVLLIGPSGVGKTALVHELVRQRSARGLGGRSFWATSGARLVAGQSGFGMWQERCHDVLREASRKQAILHLGNLLELLEVGKSEHQSQGLMALPDYEARRKRFRAWSLGTVSTG